MFVTFVKKSQRKMDIQIASIKFGHGTKFDCAILVYYVSHGIGHNFSAFRTPQQNSIIEGKT